MDDTAGIIDAVKRWARSEPAVEALALVGSRARGGAEPGSDVDLVLITGEPARFVQRDDWAVALGGQVVRTRRWGILTERRVRLADGIELDVGVVGAEWARTHPVDPGTAAIVRGGIQVLLDPHGILEAMLREG